MARYSRGEQPYGHSSQAASLHCVRRRTERPGQAVVRPRLPFTAVTLTLTPFMCSGLFDAGDKVGDGPQCHPIAIPLPRLCHAQSQIQTVIGDVAKFGIYSAQSGIE